MSNELTKINPFDITTFSEAEKLATMISNSSLCPTGFKNKPGDVFVAMQMGHEVGLSPMQAIQNIAVINGRPSLWGDAAIGLVRSHPHCQSVREWHEGSITDGTLTAFCGVIRKGQQEEIRSFSMEEAKKAGLWSKAGVWSQYPQRMLQMRARGFAIRDTFPDALRGLHLAEESQDIIDVTPMVITPQERKKIDTTPASLQHVTDPEVVTNCLESIENSTTMDILKNAYADAKKACFGDKDALNSITIAVRKKRDELKNPPIAQSAVDEFYKEYDSATGEIANASA